MHETRNTVNETGSAPSFAMGTAAPDNLIAIMKNKVIVLEPVLKVDNQPKIVFSSPPAEDKQKQP